MLCDKLGRIHDYLRISLTEKCNLRCTYCMPEEGVVLRNRSFFMNKNEVIEIAKKFVSLGVNKIRLTGGEPLVCKDAHEIISNLSGLPVELAITTNSVLADKFLDTFKKAGIHSVNVSLDTLNSEKFFLITRRNEFEKVLSNIHLLLLNNFFVKVNMVVMRGVNENEILDFVEWTKKFPIHIRFIEFMPFKGNSWQNEKVFPLKNILSLIESKYDFIKLKDDKNGTAKKFKVINHDGTFAVISTMSEPFCETCNRLRLTADGKIKNCLFSNGEIDLLTPLRKGENILPMIEQCVKQKKEKQGGQFDSSKFLPELYQIENRTMIAIGG